MALAHRLPPAAQDADASALAKLNGTRARALVVDVEGEVTP